MVGKKYGCFSFPFMLTNLQRRTLKNYGKTHLSAVVLSAFHAFSPLLDSLCGRGSSHAFDGGIHGKPRSRRFQRGNSFCDFCLGRLVLLETAPNFSAGLKRVGASAKSAAPQSRLLANTFPKNPIFAEIVGAGKIAY